MQVITSPLHLLPCFVVMSLVLRGSNFAKWICTDFSVILLTVHYGLLLVSLVAAVYTFLLYSSSCRKIDKSNKNCSTSSSISNNSSSSIAGLYLDIRCWMSIVTLFQPTLPAVLLAWIQYWSSDHSFFYHKLAVTTSELQLYQCVWVCWACLTIRSRIPPLICRLAQRLVDIQFSTNYYIESF